MIETNSDMPTTWEHMSDLDRQTEMTLTMFEGQWADHGDEGGGGFHFVVGQHEKSPSRIYQSDVLNYAEDLYKDDKGYVQAQQRARRVRVCVNACAGVSSSVLEASESGGPNVAEWFRDWSALPAEAHELGVKEWADAMTTRIQSLEAALKPIIDCYGVGYKATEIEEFVTAIGFLIEEARQALGVSHE